MPNEIDTSTRGLARRLWRDIMRSPHRRKDDGGIDMPMAGGGKIRVWASSSQDKSSDGRRMKTVRQRWENPDGSPIFDDTRDVNTGDRVKSSYNFPKDSEE